MKKVAIVILNWNGLKNTIECLNSVSVVDKKNFTPEIIIVDNASTDNSVSEIKKLFPKLTFVENSQNYGFAKGNNLGIKKALELRADFVMLLNNDTVLEKNSIQGLIEASEKYPDYSVFAPKIYFEKGFEFHKDRYIESERGKVIWYAGGKIDWNNIYGKHIGIDIVDNGEFDKFCETEFATGAAVMIKKEVFAKAGFLDEDYYLYYEDTDFSVRAKNLGFKILFVPDSLVWHKNAGSSASGSTLQDYYITRNRLIFGFKYASVKTKLALLKESFKILFSKNPDKKTAVLDFFKCIKGKR